MGRPRKPTEQLELNGAFKHDPQRARPVGPKSKRPIGDPPAYFSAKQKECWLELVGDAPAGVLMRENRCYLEIASKLLATERSKKGLPIGKLALLKGILERMGLTPSDRSKVHAGKDDEESPEDEFKEFEGPARPGSERVC